MQVLMFANEKFSYDKVSKSIYVDNYDKGTRAVFHIDDNGVISQKTKTGCNAEGLILLYKTIICG